MAYETEEYKDGGQASYTFSIEKIKDEDIKVSVDGTNLTYTATNPPAQTTEYTVNGSNVIFKQASVSGSANGGVRIYRETALENADSATFVAGSSIRAADLNANHKLVRFSAQEKNQKIVTDDIRDSQVTSAKILDGTIVDADINASANIQGSKILNDSLTLDKLGAGALPTDITVASANIVDETIVDGDINANANIQGTKLLNDSVPLTKFGAGALPTDITVASANIVDGTIDTADLKNSAVTQNKLDDNSVGTPELINGSVTDAKIETGTLDNRYFTETELDPTANTGQNVLDARYYTETEADARFYNLASAEEIQSGETWVAADNKVATTSAIDARIIDLVDDVGGFHPIPNETSFPSVNIDVNNGAGTLISIKEISTARTPSSGTVTITDGAGTGNDVVINGCGSTVLPAGFGVIVETTTTLHTYTFHRLQPKATEVTTVAGSIANVNTTAGSIGNVNIVAPDISNVNTVAGSIGSVNTVAGSISSVNNASSNISSINNFGDLYQVNSSNPSTDGGGASLAAGDLYFNTSADRLKVYTGTDWVDGVIASGGGAQTSGDTFTGDLKVNDNVKLLVGTDSDLQIYHDGNSRLDHNGSGSLIIRTQGTNEDIQILAARDILLRPEGGENGIFINGNGSVELYYDNSKKLETTATGAKVTGDILAEHSGGIIQTLQATTGAQSYLKFINSETGSGLFTDGLLIGLDSDETAAFWLYEDKNMRFATNGTERFRINSGGNIDIPADNAKLRLGASTDLQIYHNGTNSVIDNNTGRLELLSTGDIILKPGDKKGIICTEDAQVELYYNDFKKLETTSTGVTVTGREEIDNTSSTSDTGLTISNSSASGFTFAENLLGTTNKKLTPLFLKNTGNAAGTETYLAFQAGASFMTQWNIGTRKTGSMTGDFIFHTRTGSNTCGQKLKISHGGDLVIPNDNAKLQIGESQDLELYHTGSANHIDSANGALAIRSDVFQISTLDGTHKYIDIPTDEQGVEFYYDNTKKFETTNDGATVTGQLTVGLNTSSCIDMFHFGNTNFIKPKNGSLDIINPSGNANVARFIPGGAVELWHNGSKKLETTTTGTTITGRTRQNVNSSTALPTGNNFGNKAWEPYDHEAVLYNDTQGNEGSFAGIFFNAGADSDGSKVGTARISAVETGHHMADLVFGTRNTSFTEKLRILADGKIRLPNDSQELQFGADQDLKIYHDGNSRIDHDGGGILVIRTLGAQEDIQLLSARDILLRPQGGENGININGNGSVELYHNDVKKLETTSTGATVTGTLEADSFGDIKLADPFIEMAQTITTSRTISNNYNAFTVGPVTINTGVTVTVGDGENWVIV